MRSSTQNRKTICRFCWVKCDDFEVIGENMERAMDMLLLKVIQLASDEPVICTNCAERVKEYVGFKATCLNTHGYIRSFINPNSNVKLDLKDVYLSKKESNVCIPGDYGLCGFCMELVKSCSAMSLDNKEGDNNLQRMLTKCLPEVDLNIIDKPIICVSCYEFLEGQFQFVTNHLNLEEKMKKYCDAHDNNKNNERLLDLTDMLTLSNILMTEERNTADIIDEEDCIMNRENADELIEDKNNFFMGLEHNKLKNVLFAPKTLLMCEEEDEKLGIIKTEGEFCVEHVNEIGPNNENFVEICFPDKDIEIKTDQQDSNRLQFDVTEPCINIMTQKKVSNSLEDKNLEDHISIENDSSVFQCESCSFHTKYKVSLKRHSLLHKNVTEITTYQCEFCTYKTKRKYYLNMHVLTHKQPSEIKMYECESCDYQTKYKDYMKKHILIHKAPSEIPMYHCEFCSFKTKHQTGISKHVKRIHKDDSEVKVYQCETCSFQTKYKESLLKHLMVHKDSSEVIMYRCETCEFQTKYKVYLKKHMLIHKDPSEIAIYHCEYCSFKTKHQKCIAKHVQLRHKDRSEMSIYQCETCSFQTKYRESLKTHLLKHKGPLDVTMYQCDFCSYKTKLKGALRKHTLIHRDSSGINMYKCDSCPYEAKYKVYLTRHKLTHTDPLQLTGPSQLHQCELCPFNTTYRRFLKRHMTTHKLPSEITMYQCESCTFQTKYKHNLKKHIVVHKAPSEITMYQCDSCPFQTKYKSGLVMHMFIHKDYSETSAYQCEFCSFQTKSKFYLNRHLLNHRKPRKLERIGVKCVQDKEELNKIAC